MAQHRRRSPAAPSWAISIRLRADEIALTDTSWLGLLQQALDGYATEDDVPRDVAKLVTKLQTRITEMIG